MWNYSLQGFDKLFGILQLNTRYIIIYVCSIQLFVLNTRGTVYQFYGHF